MPDSHKPVQPSRTPLEAGKQLLRFWLEGVERHKKELLQQQELCQEDQHQVGEEDFPDGQGLSDVRFAALLDAEEYIRAALTSLEAIAPMQRSAGQKAAGAADRSNGNQLSPGTIPALS